MRLWAFTNDCSFDVCKITKKYEKNTLTEKNNCVKFIHIKIGSLFKYSTRIIPATQTWILLGKIVVFDTDIICNSDDKHDSIKSDLTSDM